MTSCAVCGEGCVRLRVVGCGFRVASYVLRVAGYVFRVAGYALRVVSCVLGLYQFLQGQTAGISQRKSLTGWVRLFTFNQ